MNEVTEVTVPTVPLTPRFIPIDPYDAMIAEAARTPGFDVGKFAELLKLKEAHDAQVAKRAFHADLAKARKKIKPVVKNRTVKYQTTKGITEYEHEDLAAVQTAVDEILADHGFSYYWETKSEPNEPIQVTCVLTHEGGHSIQNKLHGPRDDSGQKNAIQQIGSSLTYLERYTLKALLGLAAAKDTDGLVVESGGKINDVQTKEIYKLIEEHGRDEKLFLAYYKISKVEELPSSRYEGAVAALKAPKPKHAEPEQATEETKQATDKPVKGKAKEAAVAK